MNNKSNIVIFGINGWLGKSILDFLINHLKIDASRVVPISSSRSSLKLMNNHSYKCYSYDEALSLKLDNVIFFHLAFKLRDLVSSTALECYIKDNLDIRAKAQNLIEYFKPDKIIYSSSGAVYEDADIEKNPYGVLKAKDEEFFSDLSEKFQSDILIARIFNLAGPYINKLDVYALGSFIKQATQNKKIIINAHHAVIRSYIHVFDLANIMLNWAFDKDSENVVFDTAGEDVELGELALLVNKTLKFNVPIVRQFDQNLERSIYMGDSERQNLLLERYKLKLRPYNEAIKDTYNYIKQENE